jgi:hypothetical protein
LPYDSAVQSPSAQTQGRTGQVLAEAVWKRIFAESTIVTPLHSRSLSGFAYFWEHGGTQGIWVPIYAALQLKIKP